MQSHEIHVGKLALGGGNPIRLQSMTTASTNDVDACVSQAERIIRAGADLVRFTTQGRREVENLARIKERLRSLGYDTPLVADVHFNADVADFAATVVEKVRINPGNYVDPARQFKHLEYTDEEYQAELRRLDERFMRLLAICREHHTALRIGVNHGSLSDRIMSRYGDTPAGIVESCMEFLRICQREGFLDVVVSIKASNVLVMVESVRLLSRAMKGEGMDFPLHLGVTEAGEGEDGRIKSACGIGTLLTEGLGDTIRVSLSEEPECEIPVAARLVESIAECRELRARVEENIADDTLTLSLDECDWEVLALKASMAAAPALIERRAHKLVIEDRHFSTEQLQDLVDRILQATRIKFTRTEYISCPGCGRTLYDLQSTIRRIKAATSHLVGLKIGIMGCIVNGPGEMADADYGYVGAARGKVSLYRGKECVEMNIPEDEAVEKLLELIDSDRECDK